MSFFDFFLIFSLLYLFFCIYLHNQKRKLNYS
jgi:hypothetical protein